MAKRQPGYLVRIELFLPVQPKELKSTVAVGQAIMAAENGDLTQLRDAKVRKFSQRYTTFPADADPQVDIEDATNEPEKFRPLSDLDVLDPPPARVMSAGEEIRHEDRLGGDDEDAPPFAPEARARRARRAPEPADVI